MIQNIAIVGMGALGLLYADQLTSGLGERASVSFLMDSDRMERHRKDIYSVNGVEKNFRICSPQDLGTADLVIVALKYPALASALELMAPCIGSHTLILSVMNGVSSEEILAARFGSSHLLYAIAQGMDALREGSRLVYTKCGELHIGPFEGNLENVEAVEELFVSANVPYVTEKDILYRLWFKFMLNVGINQTCLCYDCNYREALTPGTPAYQSMRAAMLEAIAVANARGIALSSQDMDTAISILSGFDPESYPSMEQDGKAKRPSEVEMFAGHMLRLGEQYGIPTPANRFFYDRIHAIEAAY